MNMHAFLAESAKAHNNSVKPFVALLLTRTPGCAGRRLPRRYVLYRNKVR